MGSSFCQYKSQDKVSRKGRIREDHLVLIAKKAQNFLDSSSRLQKNKIKVVLPGYARIMPSGTLNPLVIAIIVIAAAKLPPAESPTMTTFLGFIPSYASAYVTNQ